MAGPWWSLAKNRCKARAYAVGCGLVVALVSAQAQALAAHVDNRCPKLSAAAYEELDARVLLLLKSEESSRSLPAVVCTGAGSWVEWDERRYEIVGRTSIQDEVLDIVEAELHDAERNADADPKTTEAAAVAAGQPMLERGNGTPPPAPPVRQPADRVAVRAVDARGGGITLGTELELESETIGAAVGPVFDFGTSVGPLTLGGREAFRFTTSKRQVSFMDFEGSVAYGAPLNPDKLFGAVARFGAEWMVAYPEGNSAQAVVVPMVDVGLRLAHSWGLLGVWFGVDTHFRLATLSLGTASPLVANDLGLSFSMGVSFIDWSRK